MFFIKCQKFMNNVHHSFPDPQGKLEDVRLAVQTEKDIQFTTLLEIKK